MTTPHAIRATRATGLALAAAWIGAGILFAAVLAPAAFAVLPTRTLAGALVGRVLPTLFWWGVGTGLVMAALELRSRRRLVTVGTVAGLVTAVSCAVGQLVVAPRIERVRATIPGAVDDLAPTDTRRVQFGRLHGTSVLWLGVGMLGAAVGAGSAIAGIRRD